MNYVHPFMLVDGDKEAMEFDLTSGSYDASLATGSQYVEGDIVFVDAGKVKKVTSVTAATVAGYNLYLAGADYSQPFAKQYLLDAGVPLNVIPRRNRFVMTYRGNVGAGADYAFAAGDLQAVQARAKREIAYDTTEECLVVTNGTSNPKCTLLGVFKGGVGDNNVQVIVQLDALAGS